MIGVLYTSCSSLAILPVACCQSNIIVADGCTVCTGNYAKELEEDYTVYDAISEVQGILGANEVKCNALKAQYSKYGYLWKRDLNETLKV